MTQDEFKQASSWASIFERMYNCKVYCFNDFTNIHGHDDVVDKTNQFYKTMRAAIRESIYVISFMNNNAIPTTEIVLADQWLRPVFFHYPNKDIKALPPYPFFSPNVTIYTNDDFSEALKHFLSEQ